MSNLIRCNTLNELEILSECRAIRAKGIDNVMLVTDEHKSKVGIDYFRSYVSLVRQAFNALMMEVQPLSQAEYAEMKGLGLDGRADISRNLSPATYQRHHLR